MSASVDRVGANDLTTLATDRGQVPMNIAALLLLRPGAGADPSEVVSTIAHRLASIGRFRQRLVRAPFGAGRPYWIDDGSFDIDAHVSRASHGRATEATVLDLAAEHVCRRLPPERPLWKVAWSETDTGRVAVIIVLHHVLADGMGGLAVFAAIADGVVPQAQRPGPVAHPSRWDLTRDALRGRVQRYRDIGQQLRGLGSGLKEMGMGRQRPRLAARTSLTRRTGGRRVVRTAVIELDQVRRLGSEHSATINDVVISAVAGAMFELLARRAEFPPELVISVPVSARQSASAQELGNQVGAVPVAVPRDLAPVERMQVISVRTTEVKAQQRGSSALVLSWFFRGLAAVHLGQYVVDHQRLVHTFETNLRGPARRLVLAGAQVERIVPIAVNPGNVAVSFDVLSYAGELVVAIVVDPQIVPEVDTLAELLEAQLRTH